MSVLEAAEVAHIDEKRIIQHPVDGTRDGTELGLKGIREPE